MDGVIDRIQSTGIISKWLQLCIQEERDTRRHAKVELNAAYRKLLIHLIHTAHQVLLSRRSLTGDIRCGCSDKVMPSKQATHTPSPNNLVPIGWPLRHAPAHPSS